jgi:hypothetical protein
MRPFLAILALAAAFASPSFAATVAEMDDDEVIATAQAKPNAQVLTATATQAAPTVTTKPMTTQEQIAAFLTANPAPEFDDGPRGLVPADRAQNDLDENGKRKVHGSVSASVGTGGYRSFTASALFPVGETTTVGVAVSKTDCGKRGGCYDPYYGGPYAYGGYGPGYGYGYEPGLSGAGYGYGYGQGYGRGYGRGGERQSVALSVMTGDRQRADTPEGCAPGFRADGRYVEPLWVEGMRDGNHPCSAAAPAR